MYQNLYIQPSNLHWIQWFNPWQHWQRKNEWKEEWRDEWKESRKKIPIPIGSGYNFISYLISLLNNDLPWKETSHYNWGTSPSQQLLFPQPTGSSFSPRFLSILTTFQNSKPTDLLRGITLLLSSENNQIKVEGANVPDSPRCFLCNFLYSKQLKKCSLLGKISFPPLKSMSPPSLEEENLSW